MANLGWIISAILLIVVIALGVKIYMLYLGIREIDAEMDRFLSQDTNVLISVSVDDKLIRRLAHRINTHLSKIRKLRIQYVNGDKELKEAITNISHDLRTPLTAIWGYLDLLERLDEGEVSEDVSRYLVQIRERTECLKQLTEELFAYSLITSVPELTYEKVEINRAIEEAMVSFYGAFTQAGIEPHICICEKKIVKQLDKTALLRIFNNIISNAIKYSDGDFNVELNENGNIIFCNTANKLSAVEVGKLFDRFYTVDASRKSTGIGLSIARMLVERMSGSIEAEYRDGSLYIIVTFE